MLKILSLEIKVGVVAMEEGPWPAGIQVYQWQSEQRASWASMIFCPGQGDVASRYKEVLAPVIEAGIKVTCFDWPGHGLSAGRRGHVGGVDDARLLLDSIADRVIAGESDLPFGISGHSMGGLMALDFMRRRAEVEFGWLSSPLLVPENGQSVFKVKLGKFLGKLFPSLTLDTGVRVADCVSGIDEDQALNHAGDLFDGLGHSRVSLGWGAALIELGDLIRSTGRQILQEKVIVASQGTDDPVCPRKYFNEFFGMRSTEELTLVFLDGALHEPFSDDRSRQQIHDLLISTVEDWRQCFGKKSESKNRA